MAPEQNMRKRVRELLTAHGLHAVSVENPACPGTPDLNFTLGWIELKQIEKWPVREDTPVRVDHFRPEQRLWIRLRERAAPGSVSILLRVGREWLLLPGAWSAAHLGCVPRNVVVKMATYHGTTGLDEKEFVYALRRAHTGGAGGNHPPEEAPEST